MMASDSYLDFKDLLFELDQLSSKSDKYYLQILVDNSSKNCSELEKPDDKYPQLKVNEDSNQLGKANVSDSEDLDAISVGPL